MVISIEVLVFAAVVVGTAAIILIIVYSLAMLKELKKEYLQNPETYRQQLYKLMDFKIFVHGLLSSLLLFYGYSFLFLINSPMLYWGLRDAYLVKGKLNTPAKVNKCYIKYKVTLGYFFVCLIIYIKCFLDAFLKEGVFGHVVWNVFF